MKKKIFWIVFQAALLFTGSVAAQSDAVAGQSSSEARGEDGQLSVRFDESEPNVVTIVSGGQVYKLNTATKSLEKVGVPQSTSPTPEKPAAEQEKIDLYEYDSGDEPFDYRLINVPTAKKVPKGTWNMNFTHRFAQPLRPLSESAPGLFGLDSMSVSSFGIMYGITDKLYLNAYRSPLCQRGLCRDIEIGLGYHFTDQDKNSPVAISAYASIEGNDNFTEEHTYNLQALFARRFGKRVFLFFSPAVHLQANGQRRFDPRPDDYFPPATVAENFHLPTNGASFGFGGMVRITPSVAALAEFTPRTGFKLGRLEPVFDPNDPKMPIIGFNNISHPEVGFGLQYSIGKHAFTLTFSNTQTTTTSRYNSSNLVLKPKDLVIGFNLFRRW